MADGNVARAMMWAGSLSKIKEVALELNMANESMALSQAEQHWLANLGSSRMWRYTVTPGQQELPRAGRSSGLWKMTVDYRVRGGANRVVSHPDLHTQHCSFDQTTDTSFQL